MIIMGTAEETRGDAGNQRTRRRPDGGIRLPAPLRLPLWAWAVIYGLVGSLWVVYSDVLVDALPIDRYEQGLVSSTKGLLYVLATAVLLFFILRAAARTNVASEETLSRSLRLQSGILDALPDIVFTLDASGRIRSWNRQAQAAVGYSPDEIIDHSPLDFVVPQDRGHAAESIQAVLGGRTTAIRVGVACKDNHVMPVHILGAPFTDADGHVVGAIGSAHDISDEIRVEEALSRDLRSYETVLEQMITALAALIEKRDRYLAGHQDRVTELAVAIADHLHIDGKSRKALQLAATCHDIGKIHIPAEILSKPGRLSAAEFEMIKAHPQIGYEILSRIDFPWPIAEIVRQHHERMDGSGYPQHLIGDDIRIEARILAVADVVEAMMSHRPYRPALGIDEALAEIVKGRGGKYEAKIVDACLDVFRNRDFHFHPAMEIRYAS